MTESGCCWQDGGIRWGQSPPPYDTIRETVHEDPHPSAAQ